MYSNRFISKNNASYFQNNHPLTKPHFVNIRISAKSIKKQADNCLSACQGLLKKLILIV
jgi:hypothetical protein